MPVPLLDAILDGYRLHPDGLHGVGHWSRVLDNALRLAPATGADVRVVTLFAVFHDARRENEFSDPEHGRRGAELARRLRRDHACIAELSDEQLRVLETACTLHTRAPTHDDPTVATCFDADRLDLPRCGIEIDPARLCTPAARDPELIKRATRLSLRGHASDSLDLMLRL
jgi:uncharacterized protein